MDWTRARSRFVAVVLGSLCGACLASSAGSADDAYTPPMAPFSRSFPDAPGFQLFSSPHRNLRAPQPPRPAGAGQSALGRATTGPGHDPAGAVEANKNEDPETVRRKLLDDLFQRLNRSSDDEEAQGVAGAIQRVWFNSGSDTADLLMGRAMVAEQAKNYQVSRKILNAIVKIQPDWAEAWNELAIAHVLSNDPDSAMADLAHVLKVEPRHFGALTGMGAILLQAKDKKGALRVFRRALEIYPRLETVRSIVRRLTIEVEGRDL